MVVTEIDIPHEFAIQPEDLLETGQRVPIDDRGYIPLLMLDRTFNTIVRPNLALVDGHTTMSLERSFGFMQRERGYGPVQESQFNDEIQLVSDRPTHWLATVITPEPLNDIDIDPFGFGVYLYSRYVEIRLGMPQANTLPNRGGPDANE